jgi:2,4-dienoyl-CoA reductase-like NADH-dependent reductase (Old Yellow Enzyme family)/thioredoxin reductase
MQKFPHLFSPIKIANHTYKNRILSAPMLFSWYALDKGSAERVYKIFEDRARGGAAEVVVGETYVNASDAPDLLLPGMDTDFTERKGARFDAYRRFVDIIKKYDAVALIEIAHAGMAKNPLPFGDKVNPWGPMGFVRPDGVTVEAFDAQKMQKVRNDFATCAEFMKAAGFDGVCVHGGHGYLFTQFLSPLINRRTDEYGGNLEKRGRFPREILGDIRKRLGPDFIIELRINGTDIVEGGTTNEEIAQFCSTLDGLVDIIHITCGLLSNPLSKIISSHYDPHGLHVERAANVKKKTKIPVAVLGGINSPEFAERVIAEGKVDFISLARQMIADPEFANKAKNGHEDEIRRCIRCFHCYDFPNIDNRTVGDVPMQILTPAMLLNGVENCTINPRANKEVKIATLSEPRGSRKVLVVGGGPGGMQAAITAYDRGHKVTLLEKDSSLGGVLKFTDNDILKVDLKNFKDLLVREVGRRKIDVRLNTEATPEFIAQFKPEAVILALGASPAKPPIPGIDTAINALDVYNPDCKIGKNVIMVGGGLAGCETAFHLADKGLQVTIIEMLKRLASEAGIIAYSSIMEQVTKRKNIVTRTGAKCIEITSHGVKIENASGKTEDIESDTVVYSLGMTAKRQETERLRAAVGKATVFEVGDCVRGAKVFEATSEGFMAAMNIK